MEAALAASHKHCARCDSTLPASSFWVRRRRGRVELQTYCKDCIRVHGAAARKEYAKTDKGKSAQRRSRTSERGREMEAIRTEGYRACGASARWTAKHKATRPEFYRRAHAAHEAVRRAIIAGAVSRPARCEDCGSPCKPDAHHHAGYGKANHLNVKWLCRKCHRAEDSRQ